MFGKKKPDAKATYEVTYGEAIASIRPMAEGCVAGAPRTFPDGTPFPAQRLIDSLAETFASVVAANLPDHLWQLVTVQMVEVRDVASGDMDLGVIDALYKGRSEFEAAGHAKQALAMVEAGRAVHRYREQSGALDAFVDRLSQERSE